MFQKTNFSGYQKDPSTNVIINTNDGEYEIYKQEREKSKQFRRMQMDIERLNKQVAELQKTVEQILNSQSGNP